MLENWEEKETRNQVGYKGDIPSGHWFTIDKEKNTVTIKLQSRGPYWPKVGHHEQPAEQDGASFTLLLRFCKDLLHSIQKDYYDGLVPQVDHHLERCIDWTHGSGNRMYADKTFMEVPEHKTDEEVKEMIDDINRKYNAKGKP